MMTGIIPDTKEARKYRTLIELIPVGRREAVTMTDLSRLMGIAVSDLKYMILKARAKAGILICSGDEGYYFPKDEDELMAYLYRRKQYIKTASIALAPFRRKVKELGTEDQTEDED